MVVQVSYPGVYVQEVPSGVRTIVGVSTSTTVFIGRARQGPLNRPIRCLNFTDYERAFSADTSVGEMTRYVKLFFLNGGTDCYAMRIANGAGQATVTLQTEAGAPSLLLTAKQAGAIGETLRAAVTYAGQQPEATFNLEVFRWETNASGLRVALDAEQWQNLSMNPNSPLFAPTFLSQNSKLVDAAVAGGAPAAANGFSQSGRPVPYNNATPSTLRTELQNLVGTAAGAIANRFEVSVDGRRYVPVDLGAIDVGAMTVASLNAFRTAFADAVAAAIAAALTAAGFPGVTVAASRVDGPAPPAARGMLDSGRPAARVHDNVVDQPAGRALEVMAVGPLSVLNNQFTTDIATSDGREFIYGAGRGNLAGGRAATVLIVNLGRPIATDVSDDFTTQPGVGSIATEAVITRRAAGVSATTNAAAFIGVGPRLPTGSVLFNDNQVRLGTGAELCSTLIFSLDDVGFDGNQSVVMPPALVVVDACLIGMTVRGSDSRLAEARQRADASLLTMSLEMNATTANQGNHCIFALNGDASRPPVDAGNQSLFVSSGTCADTGAGLSQRLPELIQLFVGELVK